MQYHPREHRTKEEFISVLKQTYKTPYKIPGTLYKTKSQEQYPRKEETADKMENNHPPKNHLKQLKEKIHFFPLL